MILLSQVAGPGIAQWAIYIVLAAAVIALVLLALRTMGIAVPPFVIQAGWILIIAVMTILAIIFLARLSNSV